MNLISYLSGILFRKVCHLASFVMIFLTLIAPLSFAEKPQITTYKTPLQAVLAENEVAMHQELSSVTISQKLNRVESPDKVTITITQSGFLDDSVEGTQEIYQLRLIAKGWMIDSKEVLVKCYRGPNTQEYVEQICL